MCEAGPTQGAIKGPCRKYLAINFVVAFEPAPDDVPPLHLEPPFNCRFVPRQCGASQGTYYTMGTRHLAVHGWDRSSMYFATLIILEPDLRWRLLHRTTTCLLTLCSIGPNLVQTAGGSTVTRYVSPPM